MKIRCTLLRRLSAQFFSGLFISSITALALPAYAEALLVPAYFYPDPAGSPWQSLNTTAAQANVSLTAILNPASGPGTVVDSNYVTAIANLHAAGGKVIGYVSTAYGTRRLSDVTNDILRYQALYQVDGFFIDEMTADTTVAHVQFYQSLYAYIKAIAPGFRVVGNPGTNVPEQYAQLPLADQLVTFEDSGRQYKAYLPDLWQRNYPKERFAHIVYAVGKSQMPGAMAAAALNGAGSVFITSRTLPNPYDGLPGYWNQEVALSSVTQ